LQPRTKPQREAIELIREIAKVNAALDKNLESMRKCVENNSILHFNFNQTVTGTHRLSSSGRDYKMQGQNLPREFKPLFKARNEGWYIGEIDQAQLEYRVAVFLGKDKAGLDSIRAKIDRHSVTAEYLFGKNWKEQANAKELRTAAKAHTFKPLFGGSTGSPLERKYYEAFKREHAGITRTQNEWINDVLRTGYLRTITGLIFYFSGTHSTSSGYVINSSAIRNYPIQSLATADIVPIGVAYLWALMEACGMNSYLVNTVHDSAVAEVHPDEIELFKMLGVYSFTTAVYGYLKRVYNIDFNVPLEAKITVTKNWGEK
jgi:DNA polymerase I-like protein with 3'-5' exonuclease and polymerase domains